MRPSKKVKYYIEELRELDFLPPDDINDWKSECARLWRTNYSKVQDEFSKCWDAVKKKGATIYKEDTKPLSYTVVGRDVYDQRVSGETYLELMLNFIEAYQDEVEAR